MSWKYREPQREDYDSDEEYEEAYNAYDDALADYIEYCQEVRRHMCED